MIRSSLYGCSLPFLMMASPALADPAAADSCAKTLSPPALHIYRAAAPDIRPNSDMKRLLTMTVMPMVMSGDMNRTTAQAAATAASICLRSLQQQPATAQVRVVSAGSSIDTEAQRVASAPGD